MKATIKMLGKNILYLLVMLMLVFIVIFTIFKTMQIEIQEKGSQILNQKIKRGYINLSEKEAVMLIDNNKEVIILDVSPEYNKEHLKGARNYLIENGSLDSGIASLDKTKVYLIYDHGEGISITAAQKLINQGFIHVYCLKGNYIVLQTISKTD